MTTKSRLLTLRQLGRIGNRASVPHLRLVQPADRPLANLSRAEKLAKAIAYLRERNLYVLDRGTRAPKWGVPGRGKA